jgi:hypothetical protein
LFKENIMKSTTKLIFAAAAVLAASSAFAQSDGQPDNAWPMNPPSAQPTPAQAQKPASAASGDDQTSKAPRTAPAASDSDCPGLPAYYHCQYPH